MRPGDAATEDGDNVLGRVADPSALDGERVGVATFETRAPRAWSGARVRLDLPRSLACKLCEGGGCDGCARSGAFRLSDDAGSRAIELTVPPLAKSSVAVRVPRPFGDDTGVRQLFVVFAPADEPDARLDRLDADLAPAPEGASPRPPTPWHWAGIAAAVAALAAVLRWLL